MFKCPNCNKIYMQWDQEEKVLRCYGSRCYQVIAVPRKIWEGKGVPSRLELQECIDAFRRLRRKR